jgi:hypothetical protein
MENAWSENQDISHIKGNSHLILREYEPVKGHIHSALAIHVKDRQHSPKEIIIIMNRTSVVLTN